VHSGTAYTLPRSSGSRPRLWLFVRFQSPAVLSSQHVTMTKCAVSTWPQTPSMSKKRIQSGDTYVQEVAVGHFLNKSRAR
jgi:hypothetical protein